MSPARKQPAKATKTVRPAAARTRPPARSGGATRAAAPVARARSVAAAGDAPRPHYWLVKSEPGVFSFDDLVTAPRRTTSWDGVRNYQARNYMRDGMRVGDLVLFYHSNAEPAGVVGIAEVSREAYPDHTAFDASHPHHDPDSDPAAPTWLMVDLRAVEKFTTFVPLEVLRADHALAGLETTRRGSRLSVHPVSGAHFAHIVALGRRG
jgi:predicted RNA-binding protein with PUA-like domain